MATNQQTGPAPRGFAAMDPEKQRAIASKGGKASGGNFRNDPARAAQLRSLISSEPRTELAAL